MAQWTPSRFTSPLRPPVRPGSRQLGRCGRHAARPAPRTGKAWIRAPEDTIRVGPAWANNSWTLARAGCFDKARTVLLAEEHPHRQARMLLNLARAALVAQRWDIADNLLASMHHVVGEPPAKLVVERLELVARLAAESALNSRMATDQAAGVLAQRLGIGADEAAELFRGHARDHGYSVAALARTVIAGTDDITSPVPTLLPGQAHPVGAQPDHVQQNRP